MLRTKQVEITGEGSATLTEMNGSCLDEVTAARKDNKSEVFVAAIVCRNCVQEWRERSVKDILDSYTPKDLTGIMAEVIELSAGDSPNSKAGQSANSS